MPGAAHQPQECPCTLPDKMEAHELRLSHQSSLTSSPAAWAQAWARWLQMRRLLSLSVGAQQLMLCMLTLFGGIMMLPSGAKLDVQGHGQACGQMTGQLVDDLARNGHS